MLTTLSLSSMFLGYIFAIIGYFKSKTDENKILFQTVPQLMFWVLLVLISLLANLLYPNVNLHTFGAFMVIIGGIGATLTTFFLGIAGGVDSLRKRKTPLAVFSFLSMVIIVLPVAVLFYPFVPLVILFKKGKAKIKNRIK